MKYTINNVTKGKKVLEIETSDAEAAAGEYISLLMIAGLVKKDLRDIVFSGDNFSIVSKGWNFEVVSI